MAMGTSKNGKVFDNSVVNLWSQLNPQNVASNDFRKKIEQQIRNTDQTIETAQLPMTPEAVAGYAQTMRNLPEYQDMVNEDQQFARMRDAVAELPVPERHGWVAPLAALTDTWTGSKMAGSVPKIEGSAELLLGLQDKVGASKKNQLEQILSATDKFKAGSVGTTKGTTSTFEAGAGQNAPKGVGKDELTAGEKKLEEAAAARIDKMDAGALQDNISLAERLEQYADRLEGKTVEIGGKKYGPLSTGMDNKTGLLVAQTGFGELNALETAVIDAASRQLKEKYGGNPTNTEGEKAEKAKVNIKYANDVNARGLRSMAQVLRDQANYGLQAKENMLKTGYATVQRFGAAPIKTGVQSAAPTKKMTFEEWKAAKAKAAKATGK